MAVAQACTRAPLCPLQSSTFPCDCGPSSSRSLIIRSGHIHRQIALGGRSEHSLSNAAHFNGISTRQNARGVKPAGVRAAGMSVSFGDGGKHEAKFQKGDAVKVSDSAVVYHVPKKPELDLKGLEGTVADVLYEFKGKPISANLPYKVKFEIEGKAVFAHLREDEIEATS